MLRTISLTEKQYKNLTPFKIDSRIKNMEADFYYLDQGNWNFNNGKYLLKNLRETTGYLYSNKMFITNMLNDNKEKLNIDSFVMPEHLVEVNHEVVGLSIPLIESDTTLGLLLKDSRVDIKTKIHYLKELGKIIEKVYNQDVLRFSFGDLHGNNFVIDKNDKKLYAIDLDGGYLDINYPFTSHYFSSGRTLCNVCHSPNKYTLSNDIRIYPNMNSDLLCYSFMILDTISKGSMAELRIDEYYDYLNYLEDLGYGSNLINIFREIYTGKDNENPYEYLDEIPTDKTGPSMMNVYKYKRRR